jgi:hypothetical protein
MDIIQLLRPVAELERELEELYAWIAASLPDDHAAQTLFHQLSNDEHAHMMLVEHQRRVARANPELFADVAADLVELGETRELVTTIKSAPKPPSATEALVLAIHIETTAAEAHLRGAMKQANPALAAMLSSLGGGDRAHLARLAAVAVERGITLPAMAVADLSR